jgi:hypothetical protein
MNTMVISVGLFSVVLFMAKYELCSLRILQAPHADLDGRRA